MSEVTFEKVKTVLTKSESKGATMACVFTCPVTNKTFEAVGAIKQKEADDLMGRILQKTKGTFFTRVKSMVIGGLARMIGGGLLGKMAKDAAMEATKGVDGQLLYTEEERNEAVVTAFKSIEKNFAWDEDKKSYVAAEEAQPVGESFMVRMAKYPIVEKDDRQVMARLLVKLSAADGHIDDDEKEMMAAFIGDVNAIDQLLEQGEPDKEALHKVGAEQRKNILMVMWALAYADEELADAERGFILKIAEAWELNNDSVGELKEIATTYVLEQALAAAYEGGKNDEAHANAIALGEKMGLSADAIKAIDKAAAK